jgi:hypothetical protein
VRYLDTYHAPAAPQAETPAGEGMQEAEDSGTQDAVQVWDVAADTALEVPRAEAVAGMIRYARSLGPGSPACGEAERQALELARGERADIAPEDTQQGEDTTMEPAATTQTAYGARIDALQAEADRRAEKMQREASGTVAVREPTAVVTRRVPDAHALLRRTLDGMGLLFTDYVAFPSQASVIAVVAWNAQAAARDAAGDPIWRAFPRLLLTSRENGSGKSTVADLSRMLLQCRSGRMSKVTPYGLTKVLGVFKEVAIADDAQNVFKSDKAGADLLSIMINGYTRGATWVSGKGGDGKVEPAWGPLMVVGKDALIKERAESLKDLIDRSAVVRMERPGRYMPEVDEDADARAASLGAALKAVTGALEVPLRLAARELAEENRGRLITDGDGGRTAQIWRPMLAIARVAGGEWVKATEQAMEELSTAGGDLLKAEDTLAELEDLRDDGRSFWDAVQAQDSPAADDLYEEE